MQTKFKEKVSLMSDGVYYDIIQTKFNDGSIKVQIPDAEKLSRADLVNIELYPTSMDDIMVVSQIVEILYRFDANVFRTIKLFVRSPMYTRYDRIMHEDGTDSFGAMCYAKHLFATGVDVIQFDDPHSDVMGKLLHSRTYSVEFQKYSKPFIFNELFGTQIEDSEFCIVAPDKGAYKNFGNYAGVRCGKTRNPETGEIVGVTAKRILVESAKKKDFLVLDDICEKGGTFIGVASAMCKANIHGNYHLCVTHGIFPEGTNFENLARWYKSITVYAMSASSYYRTLAQCGRYGIKFNCLNVYKGC